MPIDNYSTFMITYQAFSVGFVILIAIALIMAFDKD